MSHFLVKIGRVIFAAYFFVGLQSLHAGQRKDIEGPAPNFKLSDRSGKIWSLSDFKGNVVFLNFWATWCPPCVRELPAMEEMNQRMKAKNFSMIAISVDKSWREIDEFFAKTGLKPSFLVLLDNNQTMPLEYGTEKFPETYAISTNGDFLKKFIGGFEWIDPKILRNWNSFFKKTQ